MLNKTQKIILICIGLIVIGGVSYRTIHTQYAAKQASEGTTAVTDARKALLTFSETDVVLNPGQKVQMVTYEDTDCPICSNHSQIVEEMLASGVEFSVTYRYHLIPDYPRSLEESLFLECVKQMSPDAYEPFKKELFSIYSSKAYDEELLFSHAGKYAPRASLAECIKDPQITDAIHRSQAESLALGVQKVPHTFIFSDHSPIYEFLGAKPAAYVTGLIESARTFEKE